MEAAHKELGMDGARDTPPDPALAESLLLARPELAQDHEALLALGLAQARQDKHEAALATYAEAERVYRRWGARIAINRSASLIECERYAEARTLAREAIGLDPSAWAAWANLLFAIVKNGDRQGLESTLRDLDSMVPEWTTQTELTDRLLADVVVLRGRNDPISTAILKRIGRN
jgi:tetratricopeptide (TPR) repeat protein